MAQLNESHLVERLRALREPLPDDGFSARLHARLEQEAERQVVVALPARRKPRVRFVLLAAAIPLAALAAAAASSWISLGPARHAPAETPAPKPSPPALRTTQPAKPAPPRPLDSASEKVEPPSAPLPHGPFTVKPTRQRMPSSTSSGALPLAPPVESPAPAEQAPAPVPASNHAVKPVERMKIGAGQGALPAPNESASSTRLRARDGKKQGAGAAERRGERKGASEQRQQRRDKSERGERRDQHRGKGGGGQGR